MMEIKLLELNGVDLLWVRSKALEIRNNVFKHLYFDANKEEKIIFDFSWTNPTHGYIDELIWASILIKWEEILDKYEFVWLEEKHKPLFDFVIERRTLQLNKKIEEEGYVPLPIYQEDDTRKHIET